jgi:RNA polymerase sigma factor (sigma-70 family)
MLMLDEHTLIQECLKQNSNAQKILYKKFFPKMIAVCLRYLKNKEDASEVLNSSFLKVFEKIKQYKSEGSLEGWIKRIVINSSLDFIRSNKTYRNKFILTDEFLFYNSNEKTETDTLDMSDAETFLSNEEIFELIRALPPATRIVFNLYVIDGFKHKQIAKQLDISTGTSQWHLSNARKILQEKINEAITKKNRSNNIIHG